MRPFIRCIHNFYGFLKLIMKSGQWDSGTFRSLTHSFSRPECDEGFRIESVLAIICVNVVSHDEKFEQRRETRNIGEGIISRV